MNNYTPIKAIGEGSFAKVVLANSNITHRKVAIKIFKPHEKDEDSDYLKHCVTREIATLRKIAHKNVVEIIETFYEGNKHLHMVFEYVPNTLLQVLQDNESQNGNIITPAVALRFSYQLCCAVEACHNVGVIHRDIKPDNVLIDKSLHTLKLCDFGVAREIGPNALVKNTNEQLTEYVSTRWYRAPELLFHNTLYTNKIDLWAAGCVIYEILTGDALFPCNTESDQIEKIMQLFGRNFSKENEQHMRHRCVGFKFVQQTTTLEESLEASWTKKSRVKFMDVTNKTTMDNFVSQVLQQMLVLDPAKRYDAKKILGTTSFEEYLKQDPSHGRLDSTSTCNSMMMIVDDEHSESLGYSIDYDSQIGESMEGEPVEDDDDEEDDDDNIKCEQIIEEVVSDDDEGEYSEDFDDT